MSNTVIIIGSIYFVGCLFVLVLDDPPRKEPGWQTLLYSLTWPYMTVWSIWHWLKEGL